MISALTNIVNQFTDLWETLETFEQALLIANLVLLVFSRPIVNFLSHQNVSYGYRSGFKVTAFRALNNHQLKLVG